MTDITIAGNVYQTRKLPLFQQFHISRMLAPVVVLTQETSARIILAFAQMKEADAEYILNACMAVTQRKHEGVWAGLGTLRAPMFQDIPVIDYYDIVDAVVKESLTSFFPDLLTRATAEKTSA